MDLLGYGMERPALREASLLSLVWTWATCRRASLYIGGVWIRQPKELHMKRLLLVVALLHRAARAQVSPAVLADQATQ